jgi:hypothetical protein
VAEPDTVAQLSETVQALQARLQQLEDTVQIAQLMAGYGPAVDSGAAARAGALWADDGVYDSGVGAWTGPDGIGGMVEGPFHQSLIHEGCAHVVSAPHITVDGDTAVAICHSQLLRSTGEGFYIWRVTANRWDWQRIDGRWRITNRVNKVLDGTPDARDLFRDSL